MRVLAPLCFASVILWAALAWCTVALMVLTHTGHVDITSRDLGGSLACIDLALFAAVTWMRRCMRDQPSCWDHSR